MILLVTPTQLYLLLFSYIIHMLYGPVFNKVFLKVLVCTVFGRESFKLVGCWLFGAWSGRVVCLECQYIG